MNRSIGDEKLDWQSIPGLTSRQRAALEKGMALPAKDRYASARELWERLQPAKKRSSPEKKAAPEKTPQDKKKSSLPILAVASLLAVLAVLFLLPMQETVPENNAMQHIPETTLEVTTEPTQPPLEIETLVEFENAQLEETHTIQVYSDHNPNLIQWSTSDPQVVTVSGSGDLKAVGYGKAEVTARTGNQIAHCTVYVDRTPNIVCTYEENETGITITGYEGNAPRDMILPRKIDGKIVTKIGHHAFFQCNYMVTVQIPESITEIDSFAFLEAPILSKVIIPDSVTAIRSGAFLRCAKLSEVHIPDTVTTVEGNPFGSTPWIRNYPDPFVICGDNILIHYKGSDSTVEIPSGVKQISGAFTDNHKVTRIIIPDSVTFIGYHAFLLCTSLKEVALPNSITTIGDGTFAYCSTLSQLNLPDSVTYIGRGAFRDCTSLKTIRIPDTVTFIGDSNFVSTPWYRDLSEPFVIRGDGFLIKCNGTDSRVEIPSGVKVILEAFHENKSVTEVVIPDSVTTIGGYAFEDCKTLTSVQIPDSVHTIGSYAFHGCSKLTSIAIPDGITAIHSCTFWDCKSLKDVTLPESITSIDTRAFYNCYALKEITIPKNVVNIGRGAFLGAYDLKNVTISRNCTLGEEAFPWDCSISYY